MSSDSSSNPPDLPKPGTAEYIKAQAEQITDDLTLPERVQIRIFGQNEHADLLESAENMNALSGRAENPIVGFPVLVRTPDGPVPALVVGTREQIKIVLDTYSGADKALARDFELEKGAGIPDGFLEQRPAATQSGRAESVSSGNRQIARPNSVKPEEYENQMAIAKAIAKERDVTVLGYAPDSRFGAGTGSLMTLVKIGQDANGKDVSILVPIKKDATLEAVEKLVSEFKAADLLPAEGATLADLIKLQADTRERAENPEEEALLQELASSGKILNMLSNNYGAQNGFTATVTSIDGIETKVTPAQLLAIANNTVFGRDVDGNVYVTNAPTLPVDITDPDAPDFRNADLIKILKDGTARIVEPKRYEFAVQDMHQGRFYELLDVTVSAIQTVIDSDLRIEQKAELLSSFLPDLTQSGAMSMLMADSSSGVVASAPQFLAAYIAATGQIPNFIMIGDHLLAPYGQYGPRQLTALVQDMLSLGNVLGVDCVPVICNTAHIGLNAWMDAARAMGTSIGFEPIHLVNATSRAIIRKARAYNETNNGAAKNVVIFSTEATKKSNIYPDTIKKLNADGEANINVYSVSSKDLADDVNNNRQVSDEKGVKEEVKNRIKKEFSKQLFENGEPVVPLDAELEIVLCCTHYFAAKELIEQALKDLKFTNAVVSDPAEAAGLVAAEKMYQMLLAGELQGRSQQITPANITSARGPGVPPVNESTRALWNNLEGILAKDIPVLGAGPFDQLTPQAMQDLFAAIPNPPTVNPDGFLPLPWATLDVDDSTRVFLTVAYGAYKEKVEATGEAAMSPRLWLASEILDGQTYSRNQSDSLEAKISEVEAEYERTFGDFNRTPELIEKLEISYQAWVAAGNAPKDENGNPLVTRSEFVELMRDAEQTQAEFDAGDHESFIHRMVDHLRGRFSNPDRLQAEVDELAKIHKRYSNFQEQIPYIVDKTVLPYDEWILRLKETYDARADPKTTTLLEYARTLWPDPKNGSPYVDNLVQESTNLAGEINRNLGNEDQRNIYVTAQTSVDFDSMRELRLNRRNIDLIGRTILAPPLDASLLDSNGMYRDKSGNVVMFWNESTQKLEVDSAFLIDAYANPESVFAPEKLLEGKQIVATLTTVLHKTHNQPYLPTEVAIVLSDKRPASVNEDGIQTIKPRALQQSWKLTQREERFIDANPDYFYTDGVRDYGIIEPWLAKRRNWANLVAFYVVVGNLPVSELTAKLACDEIATTGTVLLAAGGRGVSARVMEGGHFETMVGVGAGTLDLRNIIDMSRKMFQMGSFGTSANQWRRGIIGDVLDSVGNARAEKAIWFTIGGLSVTALSFILNEMRGLLSDDDEKALLAKVDAVNGDVFDQADQLETNLSEIDSVVLDASRGIVLYLPPVEPGSNQTFENLVLRSVNSNRGILEEYGVDIAELNARAKVLDGLGVRPGQGRAIDLDAPAPTSDNLVPQITSGASVFQRNLSVASMTQVGGGKISDLDVIFLNQAKDAFIYLDYPVADENGKKPSFVELVERALNEKDTVVDVGGQTQVIKGRGTLLREYLGDDGIEKLKEQAAALDADDANETGKGQQFTP